MKLSDIKGIKEKRIKALNEAGFFTPEDLLLNFPVKYIDTNKKADFLAAKDGDNINFIGTLNSMPTKKYIKKGLYYIKADILSQGKIIKCTWFNQPYIQRQLSTQKLYCFDGRIKKFKNSFEIVSPRIYALHEYRAIIPIYSRIKGISQSLLEDVVPQILDNVTVSGYFDNAVYQKFSLIPLNQAIKTIHLPDSIENAYIASTSAAVERLACSLVSYNIFKSKGSSVRKFNYSDFSHKLNEFIKSLDFELTQDQKSAIDDIIKSFHTLQKTNRLVQGDVGCGKTIVAFCAMYYAYLNGYQSVLMAPTEILARQHYQNACEFFEQLGVKIAFLSGGQSKKVRDAAVFNIKHGAADMIIGTHAVFSSDIEFSSLALIITDEQQRFGVAQRANLENKTEGADIIVMSATPIPRTLALTLYGDLELSSIKTMPKFKAKITTHYVPQNKQDDMLQYIKKCAENNLQTYIVCPRVEEDEEGLLITAEGLYKQLAPKLGEDITALMHGKMKEREKAIVMQKFASGEAKILISTSLVEVGLDVPQAVNMVIYNPERYGLSQLHQMRGRVGRSNKQSYCFLVCDKSDASKRLDNFVSSTDGFYLAECDFQTRGAGDFLGTRQHGKDSDIKITPELLEKVKNIADFVLNVPDFYMNFASSLDESDINYIKSITLN